MTSQPPFAIFFDDSAYSTDKLLMGRQVAGSSFLRGVAHAWQAADIEVVSRSRKDATLMHQHLARSGFEGRLAVSLLPAWDSARKAGCLYFPSPAPREIAQGRDALHPTAFSIMGVTHTLCSRETMDRLANLVLPPFRPWDALICTSQAVRTTVATLHEEMREHWRTTTGATRLNQPVLPVIPLGINTNDFLHRDDARAAARAALGLDQDQIAFLFVGRLAYHAKANPAPLYQALERLAATRPIALIEAGVHGSEAMRLGLETSRRFLAPSVKTVQIDGSVQSHLSMARAAADIFVSLSDNIQESFGLTPIEAMASGLPVVVSDWDGYKDTVRHGIDGFRVATVMPGGGTGDMLTRQYHLGAITYDQFIGGASLATYVDSDELYQALDRLAGDPDLRRRMGQSGQQRARADFDWSVVLRRYADLTVELKAIREHAQQSDNGHHHRVPYRDDPFHRFRHFSTSQLQADWHFLPAQGNLDRLQAITELPIARFGFDQYSFPASLPRDLLKALPPAGARADEWLAAAGMKTEFGVRALMWLWKFGLIRRTTDIVDASPS